MKPIELPVFWMDANQCKMKELGIESEDDVKNLLDVYEVRKQTFCHIATYTKYRHNDDGERYSQVHTNGTEYVVNMPYKKLNELILNLYS